MSAGREVLASPRPRLSERVFSPAYRRLTLGIISVVALIAFEAMAVATAMPVAVRDLRGLPLYAWAFSGFLAASLFGMVLAGELSDTRGPRLPLLAGVGSFAGGLVIAGGAASMWTFVAARAVQGFGAGLVIVALYVLVARCYPDGLRPRVFAVMAGAWVVPSIVGPPVAGWLADHATWRLVFLAVPPLVIPPALLLLPWLRSSARRTGSGTEATTRAGRKRRALAAAVGRPCCSTPGSTCNGGASACSRSPQRCSFPAFRGCCRRGRCAAGADCPRWWRCAASWPGRSSAPRRSYRSCS